MTQINAKKVATILTTTLSGVLALGLAAAIAAPALGQAHGTWTFTGSMHISREQHSATLLKNGEVLVAGGVCVFSDQCDTPTVLASAELYDPSTGTWTETGSMSIPRASHRATLLKNGEVLVTGGFDGNTSAELYNPSTGTWSTTGSMTMTRYGHGAALLQNGEVLVAGGDIFMTDHPTAAAEIYDPSTGTFTATGSMHDARSGAPLTLLRNGKVLIAGGKQGNASCTAELFSNGQWSLTANLVECATADAASALQEAAVLLRNGDVLIEDGNTASEFYDPSTNVWQATLGRQSLNILQHDPLALLATGKVLLAGVGVGTGSRIVSKAALYDPSTNKWTLTGSMHAVRRFGHTLTRLLNGKVLAAGGESADTTFSSAELYTP